MREEYDFSGGVRGKCAHSYARGANVVVLVMAIGLMPDRASVDRLDAGFGADGRTRSADLLIPSWFRGNSAAVRRRPEAYAIQGLGATWDHPGGIGRESETRHRYVSGVVVGAPWRTGVPGGQWARGGAR
jgi:hypothetical protein